MPKFDDASWHNGGDFPKGLPPEAGATHIAMFVAWAMHEGMAGSVHTVDFPDELDVLLKRKKTPGAWFLEACDGKFTDEDLNDEGEAFALFYYGNGSGLSSGEGSYLVDYETAFTNCAELYAVPDSWESFEVIKPVIDERFRNWKSPKPSGLGSWFR